LDNCRYLSCDDESSQEIIEPREFVENSGALGVLGLKAENLMKTLEQFVEIS
jgi:hypothetical protein